VIDATEGKVELVKVNVDENPQVSAAFRVQGIPAVYAVSGGKVVDGFVGAQPEAQVQEFVDRLSPSESDEQVAALVAAGDEVSLRQVLAERPDHHDAIVALAELLADRRSNGDTDEALALLGRIPETAETRRVAALVRTGASDGATSGDEIAAQLDALLDQVKGDDDARQQYVDLLEVLGPDDPRTADYRKRLTSRLF
jgi:putative thioredoxin